MEMQANGELPKERKIHKSIVQKINRTERLIEQYGGRVFLTKYFLPTLPEREREIFKLGVLEYSGDSVSQMATKVNMIGTNFSTKLAQIVEKLRTTDFEAVAEVVDNAKNGQELHLSADNLARVKERQALVEKYGVNKIRFTKNIELTRRLDTHLDIEFDLNGKTFEYSASKPITVNNATELKFKDGTVVLQAERGSEKKCPKG